MQMSQVYDEKIEIFFLTKQKMPNKTIVCKKKLFTVDHYGYEKTLSFQRKFVLISIIA